MKRLSEPGSIKINTTGSTAGEDAQGERDASQLRRTRPQGQTIQGKAESEDGDP
ncbi:MAG: hypothetical protein ACE5NG_02510 [bacterium]